MGIDFKLHRVFIRLDSWLAPIFQVEDL